MSSENLNNDDFVDDLPPDLKAMEAGLAGLCPRDDRLDRERLAFLAGRASMTRELSRRSRGWPTAFAGMTTVAAALLVMLLFQRDTGESTEIGNRPTQRRIATVDARVPNPGSVAESPSENNITPVRAGSDQSVVFSRGESVRSRAIYLEMCDWMLSHGVDPWTQPLAEVSSDDTLSPGPLSYQRWRSDLLESEKQSDLLEMWQNNFSGSGVEL